MTSHSIEISPEGGQPLALNWTAVAFFSAVHALALLAPWFFSWSALTAPG